MRWYSWLILFAVAAILGGLWWFNRIQWGPQGPMGPMPVLVAPLEEVTYQPVLNQTGRLSALAEAEIRPQLQGVISRVHFAEGQQVKAGDVLFTLDLRAFNAPAQQAAAQLQQAKAAYARGVELRKQDAISEADLETRRAAFLAAQAASSGAGVSGSNAVVRSPIGGKVGRAEVTLGSIVTPQTLLTTVQQTRQMHVDFDISEQVYLQLVQDGTRSLIGSQVAVGLATAGSGGASPTANAPSYPFEGTLTGIDNRLGETTGNLRLRATFENPEDTLLPGLFARVQMALPISVTALLVNDAAVGTEQTLRFVYKINAQGQPERVTVTPGDLVGGLRAIASPNLRAGDRVVVNGLLRIRPGMEVVPMPADMRSLQPVSPTTAPTTAG